MSITVTTVRSDDGTRIAFDRVGEGPAVIQVGAATQYRDLGDSQRQLAELLKVEFTVITYDRRGRGQSGDTLPYAVEREIEDIAALVDVAGGRAALLGGSSGAVLALRAAAHGLPICSLALYEPPFIIDDSRDPLPADYVETLDALTEAGRGGDALLYFMTAAVGVPESMLDGMRQSPMWPKLTSVAHTIAYDGRIMGDTMSGDPAALDEFAHVSTPTLVLSGGASPQFMLNGNQALANVLPHSEYRVLPGQTHAVEPDVLAPLLREFYARFDRRG